MKKIPTLYVRDSDDRRYVTDEVTPGCEWVLAGEGTATRKIDGTCVMLDEHGDWWARREVKPNKPFPNGYIVVERDETTGKIVGWEPIIQSPFYKFFEQALRVKDHTVPGTYELYGEKINGNPENTIAHGLVMHDPLYLSSYALQHAPTPRDAIEMCRAAGWEGVVWHHPDGRMAKLKVKDYPEEE